MNDSDLHLTPLVISAAQLQQDVTVVTWRVTLATTKHLALFLKEDKESLFEQIQ